MQHVTSSTKFFPPFMPKQKNSDLSFYLVIPHFGLICLSYLKLVEICGEPTFG